jgi:CheY-like chemotaxis protein
MLVDNEFVETSPRSGGYGKLEWIIRNQEPLLFATRDESMAWYTQPVQMEYIGQPFASWIGVPMIIGKYVLGAIAAYDRSEEYLYDEIDVEALSRMAKQAALALERARSVSSTNKTFEILHIEDSKNWRDLVEEVLSTSRFQVFSTASASEGLSMLQSHCFDLVILDLALEHGMSSGDTLLRELEKNSIPCLIMTGMMPGTMNGIEERYIQRHDFVQDIVLKGASSGGDFAEELLEVVESILFRPQTKPSVFAESKTILVATFGVNIEQILSADKLPAEAPTRYTNLCDWLEQDLERRLQESYSEFQYPEAPMRNGETLSVRIVFPWDRSDQPDFGDLGWWNLLEVLPFEQVYPNRDAMRLRNQTDGG